MAIPLNKDLVRRLITQRFGSVDALVVEWEERMASDRRRTGRARDRSTVYRWIERGLPSKRDDVFDFASLLDVDPVGILDLEAIHEERIFEKERRLFQRGQERLARLSALWPIYVPGPAWPDEEIAQTYYGRPWFVQEFEHDPAKISDVYAAVYLSVPAHGDPSTPRTYHFAYRRTGARDGMWRPYGTVIGLQNEVCLLSESGDYQRLRDTRSSWTVVAETYFGPGPAEFRIASLHDFDMLASSPSREKSCVRFVG